MGHKSRRNGYGPLRIGISHGMDTWASVPAPFHHVTPHLPDPMSSDGHQIMAFDARVNAPWERITVKGWLTHIEDTLYRWPWIRMGYIGHPINLGAVTEVPDDDVSATMTHASYVATILHECKERWPHILWGAPLIYPTYLGQRYGHLHSIRAIEQADFIPIIMEWSRDQRWMLPDPWNWTAPGLPYWWLEACVAYQKPLFCVRVGRRFHRTRDDERLYLQELRCVDDVLSRLPFVYGATLFNFTSTNGQYTDRQIIGTSILSFFRRKTCQLYSNQRLLTELRMHGVGRTIQDNVLPPS